jgi:hypothetical protein
MSKITPRLSSIAFCLFLVSCDTATPENYFDRAVLNCNLMHGFAGSGLRRELESPSVKLSETGNGETIPMKRKEAIDNAITSLETNFEKVKKLKETDDTRDILQASIALYEFVLPVYKTEYSSSPGSTMRRGPGRDRFIGSGHRNKISLRLRKTFRSTRRRGQAVCSAPWDQGKLGCLDRTFPLAQFPDLPLARSLSSLQRSLPASFATLGF